MLSYVAAQLRICGAEKGKQRSSGVEAVGPRKKGEASTHPSLKWL